MSWRPSNRTSARTCFPDGDPNVNKLMGLLPTAFLLSYMIAAPLFGWLSDRMNRWWIISGGVIVWSLASGGSGLATTYTMLLITRLFIGFGEAAYGPAAPTVLADLFPVERRGRILSLFYVAIPVGSALGFLLGGSWPSDSAGATASMFRMPPGILLGIICLLMREPRHHAVAGGRSAAGAVNHSLADYASPGPNPVLCDQHAGHGGNGFRAGGGRFLDAQLYLSIPPRGFAAGHRTEPGTGQPDFWRHHGDRRHFRHAVWRLVGRQAAGSLAGLLFSRFGHRHARRHAHVPVGAGDAVSHGLGTDLSDRVLFAAQYRSGERRTGKRDAAGDPGVGVCHQHFCDPPVGRRDFAVSGRLDHRCGAGAT